jgi:hypothetical protein
VIGVLHVLDHTGDVTIQWDPDDEASTARAAEEWRRLHEAGFLMFSVVARVPDGQLHRDPPITIEAGTGSAPTPDGDRSPPEAPSLAEPRRRGRRKSVREAVGDGTATQAASFDANATRQVAVPPMRGGADRTGARAAIDRSSQPCPIPDCAGTKGDDQVMCRPHWYAVPKPIRDRVWNAYRRAPGSAEHLSAIRDAYASVS